MKLASGISSVFAVFGLIALQFGAYAERTTQGVVRANRLEPLGEVP